MNKHVMSQLAKTTYDELLNRSNDRLRELRRRLDEAKQPDLKEAQRLRKRLEHPEVQSDPFERQDVMIKLKRAEEGNVDLARRLEREIEDMEQDPEYMQYITQYSSMLHSKDDGKEEMPDYTVQGPIGKYVTRRIVKVNGNRIGIPQSMLGEKSAKKKKNPFGVNTLAPLCSKCGARMIRNDSEGVCVCPVDGFIVEDNVCSTANGIPYGESNDIIMAPTRGGYRRHNHMTETLSQMMGKESTNIPQEVLDTIQLEMKKHYWIKAEDVSMELIRTWLAKHKLAKWYEHSTRIFCLATGQTVPKLDKEQMARVHEMFRLLEEPFERCPDEIRSRNNFPSYDYILYKICELSGYDHMLPRFKLLKSSEKLKKHDEIWEYFCKELHWDFIPTPTL